MKRFIQATGVLLALVLASPIMAGSSKASDAASILDSAETVVFDMKEQAARLQSYNRAPGDYDWRIHATELQRISQESDMVADFLGEFEELKTSATERQLFAYNRAVESLARLANSTEAAIKILNDERNKIVVAHPDYTASVNTIYESADDAIRHLGVAESWFELTDGWMKESD